MLLAVDHHTRDDTCAVIWLVLRYDVVTRGKNDQIRAT